MSQVLLIKTGGTIPSIVPQHGDFESWFAAGAGVPVLKRVDVFKGEPLPPPESPRAVMITGSISMVSEREDWSEATARWLLKAMDHGVPILGVCYGHQLLAHALGGTVGPNPQGRQMGTVTTTLSAESRDDSFFSEYPQQYPVQTTHLESVIELPEGAVCLGSTALDPNHVARFNDLAWGVQYHPEFSAEVMKQYIRIRAGVLQEEGFDAEAMESEVRPTPRAHSILSAFVQRFCTEAAA